MKKIPAETVRGGAQPNVLAHRDFDAHDIVPVEERDGIQPHHQLEDSPTYLPQGALTELS